MTKKFSEMTPNRQRVEIAKDVIKQLDAKRYTASPGVYFESDSKKHCNVCALGAVFATTARKDSKIDKCHLDGKYRDFSMRNELAPYFSYEQLLLIEQAFESDWVRQFPDISPDEVDLFGAKYKNPKNRMKAIMRNIIENDGTFVP